MARLHHRIADKRTLMDLEEVRARQKEAVKKDKYSGEGDAWTLGSRRSNQQRSERPETI